MRLTLTSLAVSTALIATGATAQTPNRADLAKVVASRHDTTVKALQAWIALPTIAAEKRNVAEGADYMRRLALDAGFQKARVVPSGGVPGVFATLDAGAPVTLGIYFMYDVKQFDPAEWSSPPLEGRLVDRPGEGQVIMGRGAVNQKGPQMAFLAALQALKASGRKLPVNLVLVAEGEEEIASPNFPAVVADPEVAAALKKTVGVFIPTTTQDSNGQAGITLGAKGAVEFQLIVGGETSDKYPKLDVHSSNHARIESPAWRLVKALDSLVADDGHTPAIDGFRDNVKPLTARQKELIAQRVAATNEAEVKRTLGIGKWIGDEDYQTSSERFLGQPTVNIQGLVSGYTGVGGKTVLPGRAEAKLEFRLVPDMTRQEVETKLRAHLAKRGFDDVKVVVSGGYGPNQTDENSPFIQAQKKVFERAGIAYTLTPRNAGSWPGVVFNGAPLNLPTGQFGIGRGNGAHAPNEWFLIRSANPKVAGIDEAAMLYVDYLYEVAKLGRR
ncbi:acetylornithine deacetylase/succinyl-diaminopimelate desuccinylase-like protein [Sphingomonas kaistensis]|uniref:Acetylornithine deacetylase/succinyl-diaminopimelate desuccinylase-like protein n=1 Tax=Sphingomonas kaistensis TaxID=298708 RepID=A0A7X5Y4F6_9SPHN|nr:M20/M25/M40 family metallo-hydrolase [Sphingomonas kaistensis]NJC04560.1 acetylornithine deacetylase/succinyl-diaminopimelate desuccinylase-like protein [Sphingomonas kaistensis]